MWLFHILMLFLPFKPPLSGKVGFISLHSLEILSFWAAFAQLAPQWAITFSRTVRSNVINSLVPSHCPGGIPISSSSRYNCAYLPMSPPQGKVNLAMSWDAEENFCHCWLFDTTRLPQNLLESITGISWNLIKPQNSGWLCISLFLLRNYLSRTSLQWIDLSHFSKMLLEMCDLQETRWCFGLQGWGANVIQIFHVATGKRHSGTEHSWLQWEIWGFNHIKSFRANRSRLLKQLPTYTQSLFLDKAIYIHRAESVPWGSTGSVTWRCHSLSQSSPRGCTHICRDLVTFYERAALCPCLARLGLGVKLCRGAEQ